MANNQNSESAMAFGLVAMVGVGLVLTFGLFLIGIAAFMTLVAICAQFKPVRLGGETITAKEGRTFILYGLIGSLPCAAMLYQVAAWLNITVTKDWQWLPLVLGYSISALAITWMVETFWGEDKAAADVQTQIEPEAPKQIATKPKPFEFAEWDDEVDPYK